MKIIPTFALLALFAVDPLLAESAAKETAPKTTELKVLTDLEIAKKQAKESGKPVFLEFMSSTCGHCQAFKKNVISDPAFIDYANKNLIVVIQDYQELGKLTATEKKKRETLMEKLKVESFPTILLLDKSGKILLRTSGYNGTKAEKIVTALKEAIPK